MPGGAVHPGSEAPQQWRPGQGGPPPNTDDGDSEGESGDEGDIKSPFKIDGYNISGYDTIGAAGEMRGVAPPPQQTAPTGERPDMTFTEISVLDEAACRDAVINLAAENCCYGSKPAKEMTFKKTTPVTALHYTLETYGESRSTGTQFRPYRGGPVDGPENGPAPPPWVIPCTPDNLFQNQVKKIEVPHTSVVRGCHSCGSMGWLTCRRCHGRGRVRCGLCHGRGYRTVTTNEGTHRRDCGACCNGRRICYRCGGDGRVTCSTCDGYCKLHHYIELKVVFDNHMDDYIMERTDMPDELVRNVGGKPIFEQTLPLVWAITAYPVREVNDNSVNLVNRHRETYKSERIIMQRQVLRAVPVTEVEWDWKDERNKRLWVYGNERRVYCPDYPHKCCWGCAIL